MVAGTCTQVYIGKTRQVLKLRKQWISCELWAAGRILGLCSLPFHLFHPSRPSYLHRPWERFGDRTLGQSGCTGTHQAEDAGLTSCDGTDSAWPSTASFIPHLPPLMVWSRLHAAGVELSTSPALARLREPHRGHGFSTLC